MHSQNNTAQTQKNSAVISKAYDLIGDYDPKNLVGPVWVEKMKLLETSLTPESFNYYQKKAARASRE